MARRRGVARRCGAGREAGGAHVTCRAAEIESSKMYKLDDVVPDTDEELLF